MGCYNSRKKSSAKTLALRADAADISFFRKALLDWYDRQRRSLPWRALPGQVADPYRVWLSEIMLQQTTVAAVIPYFLKFTEKWPDVQSLAAAPIEEVLKEWAGLGYYARARNLHKCAGAVTELWGGRFPAEREQLRTLPGIGDYTAGAIAAIAFNHPAMALDGNADRVFARYFNIKEAFPSGKSQLRAAARPLFESPLAAKDGRAGDCVQAVMDLGASVCTPKKPVCGACPLVLACLGREAGDVERLPVRRIAREKPLRFGHVYVIEDESGRILVERRPEQGLLGGMLGLPTSEWREGTLPPHPEWASEAKESPAPQIHVFHVFTHFRLDLSVKRIKIKSDCNFSCPFNMFFCVLSEELEKEMPSLFRKVLRPFRKKG